MIRSSAIVLLFLAQTVAPPLSGTAKGVIAGMVVHGSTNEPVAEATVMLITSVRKTGREPAFTAKTDSIGRFTFSELEPGEYRLGATAAGFVPVEYGQRTFSSRGAPLQLVADQNMKDIVLLLTPTGTVSGRIRDENGQPLAGVPVELMSYNFDASGERRLRPVTGVETTDDRGEYRLFLITPGRYYLHAGRTAIGRLAQAPNQIREAFAPVFHPGISDPQQATPIDVRPGEEHGGINLTLQRQRFYRVAGVIVNSSTGGPPPGTYPQLRLRYYNAVNAVAPNFGTLSDGHGIYQDGRFEFRGVPPGSYMLTFAQDGLTGFLPVEVTNADVTGAVLRLTPGASIRGRWYSDNPAVAQNGFAELRSAVTGFAGAIATAFPTRNAGTLVFDNVMPGEYRLVFSGLPEDFYVQEARIGRIDALRETIRVESSAAMALDIVVASGTATISGVVWDASRRTVAGARVVIAPADRPSRPELFRDTVANQEGRFSVAGLPPGDYRAFAWESIEPYGWFDPEILSRSRAQSKSVKLVPQAREIVEVDVLR